MSNFQLVLGTHNQKKLSELVALLKDTAIHVQSLADLQVTVEAVEDGKTFADNAAIKARFYATHLGRLVLAEDSGLSVAALDGAPGVYSARFSGANANDESNNQLLLKKLDSIPDGQRQAWYTCHIALADPTGTILARAEGTCHGRILRQYHGTGGFGYDPLFEIPEYKMTFAQLGTNVKSVLSHRGRAYRKILPRLMAIRNTIGQVH